MDSGHHDELDPIRRDLLAAAISPDLARLAVAMRGHPVASAIDLVRIVGAVTGGSAWNGYTMSRAMGMSRDEARANPATGVLLAIAEYVGADSGALYEEIFKPYDSACAEISRGIRPDEGAEGDDGGARGR